MESCVNVLLSRGIVYRQLSELFPTHACRQHIQNLRLLEKEAGYSPDCIPQLEDVSNFLKRMPSRFSNSKSYSIPAGPIVQLRRCSGLEKHWPFCRNVQGLPRGNNASVMYHGPVRILLFEDVSSPRSIHHSDSTFNSDYISLLRYTP